MLCVDGLNGYIDIARCIRAQVNRIRMSASHVAVQEITTAAIGIRMSR